ncbi:MAG: Cytochrome oxidase, cbb3-type, subunit [Blastocatellia bacterium]|jgi:mono/diheme cytochrome c family protein|nr:Cytochrome oxidase, cbb3-type, subunit [Blastocatellia bacterium]
MKFVKLSFVIAALALFALACGGETTNTANQTANVARPANTDAANNNKPATPAVNTNTPPADELAAARTTYAQVCSVCHGEQGDGGTVTIEGKKLKVPSLKEGHALNHTDEQLARKINNGGDGMPAFKERLKPEQINELVRFVRREFQGGASKPKEAAPASK